MVDGVAHKVPATQTRPTTTTAVTLKPPPAPQRRHHATAPSRPARSAVIAAAAQLDLTTSGGRLKPNAPNPWQDEAWAYFAALPEVCFGASFLGNTMSKVRWYPAVQLRQNEAPVAVEDLPPEEAAQFPKELADAATEELDRLANGSDGLPALKQAMGVNLAVAGEAYLVGREPADPGDLRDETWEVHSSSALTVKAGKYLLQETPRGKPEELPEDALVYRIWRPDPQWAKLPWSPLKAALDTAEELLLFGRQLRSLAKTGSNAGVMLVPEEINPPQPAPADPDNPDAAAGPDLSPLEQSFYDAMTAAVEDDGSPSSVAPWILTGAAQYLAQVRHLAFASRVDSTVIERITHLIHRIAHGIDVPPEILTGIAAANHWCMSDDSEVYTRRGWVGIDDIAVGDEALSLDHDTGEEVWRPVTDLYRADVVDEPMLALTGQGHDSLTTMGHRWPVLYNDPHTGVTVRQWGTSAGIVEAAEAGELTGIGLLHRDNGTHPVFELAPQDAAVVPYTGRVWCPTVEETHTFLARRPGRGAPFWTGNSGWLVDDNSYKAHTQPLDMVAARGVAGAFLRPMLLARGFPPDQVGRLVLGQDPAELVTRPNRAADAKDAHDRRALSDEGLLEALGFPASMAPDQKELLQRYVLGRGIGSVNLTAHMMQRSGLVPVGSLPANLLSGGQRDNEGSGGEDEPAGGDDSPDAPLDGGDATPATLPSAAGRMLGLPSADDGVSRLGDDLHAIETRLRERLVVAAGAAVEEALRRAGARLRGAAQGPETAALGRLLKGRPASAVGPMIAAHIRDRLSGKKVTGDAVKRVVGQAVAAELADPDRLLDGAFDGLETQWHTWVALAQAEAGRLIANAPAGDPLRSEEALAAYSAREESDRNDGWAWLAAGMLAFTRGKLLGQSEALTVGERSPTVGVPYGPVTEALAAAGGSVDPRQGGAAMAGGLTAGPAVTQFLNELGMQVTARRWIVGSPEEPFEPHQNLAGVQFDDWADERLVNPGSFPRVPYLFPGDHAGCQCSSALIVSLISQPLEVAAA